jgi:hypothetical protein
VALTVLEATPVPRRADCATALAQGVFFKGNPDCTIRTLALALVCGWFRGLLGSPACGGAPSAPSPIQSAMAWLICRVAWRLVFGIDIAETRAANAEKCLQLLFAEWCKGFHYKGPRCDCHAHGIILGCVQISPKGLILCFDEWEHRRYVLTGPLISHWGAQFGLAPIDVVATRLASWICCVARAPMPDRGAMFTSVSGQAFMRMGNAAMGFGDGFAASNTFRGTPVVASRMVGPGDFIGLALRVLTSGSETPLEMAPAVERISTPGGDLHLIVPRDTAMRTVRHETIRNAIRPVMAEAPTMAREPLADFVEAFAGQIAVSDLKPPSENPLFERMTAALERAGLGTVADLVALEPEPAVGKVQATLAADTAFADRAAIEKTMAVVFNTALRTLSDTAAAIGAEARKRDEDDAFIRADLTENATVAAVRTAVNAHLRGRGMTTAAVRAIATRVAAPRP